MICQHVEVNRFCGNPRLTVLQHNSIMAENRSLFNIDLFYIAFQGIERKAARLCPNLHPGTQVIGEVKGHPEEAFVVPL